jgi:predicted acetyltransferase
VPTDEITLEPATRADRPVLANLLELYVHDLSEIFPQARVGADGRFGYDKLPLYWSEAGRFPFLIRAGGELAGFALAMRGSPATDDPEDLDVAEFFVLRGHRRAGVGRRAAPLLWDRISGSWVVRCSLANRPGLPFWESAIRGYTGGAYEARELPGDPNPWRVFSFRSQSGK